MRHVLHIAMPFLEKEGMFFPVKPVKASSGFIGHQNRGDIMEGKDTYEEPDSQCRQCNLSLWAKKQGSCQVDRSFVFAGILDRGTL